MKEKSGLPARRSLAEIMKTSDEALTPEEREHKAMYLSEVEREEVDKGYVLRPLKVEVASSQQLFKLPNGTASSEIPVVIISSVVARGNWDKVVEGDVGTMLCWSIGGRHGNPTEEGRERCDYLQGGKLSCADCLANVWGTGPNGRGKKCKEMRNLLVFHASSRAPLKLSIPPTSIMAYDEFRAKANAGGKAIIAHWTKIKLTPAGVKPVVYSLFSFDLGEPLPIDQLSIARELRDRYAESLGIVEEDDYYQKPKIVEEPDVEPQEPADPAPDKGWKTQTSADDLPF